MTSTLYASHIFFVFISFLQTFTIVKCKDLYFFLPPPWLRFFGKLFYCLELGGILWQASVVVYMVAMTGVMFNGPCAHMKNTGKVRKVSVEKRKKMKSVLELRSLSFWRNNTWHAFSLSTCVGYCVDFCWRNTKSLVFWLFFALLHVDIPIRIKFT